MRVVHFGQYARRHSLRGDGALGGRGHHFCATRTSIKQSMNLEVYRWSSCPIRWGTGSAGEKAALVAADIVKAVTQSSLLPAGHDPAAVIDDFTPIGALGARLAVRTSGPG